jgi:phage baseplate assembly protein W
MRPEVDFIGHGWAFPVAVGPGGGIRLCSGSEEIENAIRMIISTAPGERVMRPEFGCAIWEQLFAPVEPNTLGAMEHATLEALGRWEPRIDVERVQAVPDDEDPSQVFIDVTYVVKATNDRRNLVYPFYTIPREAT